MFFYIFLIVQTEHISAYCFKEINALVFLYCCECLIINFSTLSSRIGKVVASHAAENVRFPLRLHWFILCTRRSGGTAHEGGWYDQSIGSTVSDAIVRSWLWLTATRNSPSGCFSRLLQVVDN